MSDTENSFNRTKELLLKWKNDKNIQELKKFYDTKSFSGILGVERREMSHSNFIAWILNDKENHNLGQFAIRQLFDILLAQGEDKINLACHIDGSYERHKENVSPECINQNHKEKSLLTIELTDKNESELDTYLDVLETEYKRLLS